MLSPAKYTEWAERKEVDQDIQDYPSLDPVRQQDIVRKYRAMHERIHNEGLYDCPYLEYGKEMIRYSALFAGFLVALRYGWYTTSAALLGLFWVRSQRDFIASRKRTIVR
jgi:delta8-fatty-acid desaturase